MNNNNELLSITTCRHMGILKSFLICMLLRREWSRDFLVVQELRLRASVQGEQVWSLGREAEILHSWAKNSKHKAEAMLAVHLIAGPQLLNRVRLFAAQGP